MVFTFSQARDHLPSMGMVEFVHPAVRLSKRAEGEMPLFELLTIVVRSDGGREYNRASLDGRWVIEISSSVAEKEWENLLFFKKEEGWLEKWLKS